MSEVNTEYEYKIMDHCLRVIEIFVRVYVSLFAVFLLAMIGIGLTLSLGGLWIGAGLVLKLVGLALAALMLGLSWGGALFVQRMVHEYTRRLSHITGTDLHSRFYRERQRLEKVIRLAKLATGGFFGLVALFVLLA